MESFTAFSEITDPCWNDDPFVWMLSTAWRASSAAQTPIWRIYPLLALYNGPDSTHRLRVRRIWVWQTTLVTQQGGYVTYNLQHISDVSGGTILAPVKMDRAAADLPAQIVAASNPDSTTTILTPLNRRWIGTSRSWGALMRDTDALVMESCAGGELATDHMWYERMGMMATQRLVLREGEGIGIVRSAAAMSGASVGAYGLSLSFLVQSTGACYVVRASLSQAKTRPVLGLLNGAGSGVVLEVYDVRVTNKGTVEPPFVTMEQLETLVQGPYGVVVTPTPHDRASQLDSHVTCYEQGEASVLGQGLGNNAIRPAWRSISLPVPVIWPNTAVGGPFLKGVELYRDGMLSQPWTLNPGQGVSVTLRSPVSGYTYEVAIEFDQESILDVVAPSFAGIVSATDLTNGGEVLCTWAAASDAGGVAGYRVYYGTVNNVAAILAGGVRIMSQGTTAVIGGLTDNVPVYFMVRAVDWAQNEDSNVVIQAATPRPQPRVIVEAQMVADVADDAITADVEE